MPTPSNRNCSFIGISILSLVAITLFSGCDLGTYKNRLNESPAQQTAPEEPASENADEASEDA